MSSDMSHDSAFQQFLVNGEIDVTALTPEESVQLYRSYQHDVVRLKEKLAPSLRQAQRGETRPLDVEAMLARVRQRLDDSANAEDEHGPG